VVGPRQRLLVERRRGVERPDAAFSELLQQVFARRLGIDHRGLEMVAVLARDLLHDLPGPLEVDLAPAPPQLPTSSGIFFSSAAAISSRRSRLHAWRANIGLPAPSW